MSLLRANLKSLLWLVLVAWFIQMPLAALHSHASDGGKQAAHASLATAATHSLPHEKSHDESKCPVCWSIATASAALLAQPPVLLGPPQFVEPIHGEAGQTSWQQARASPFDARGPPHA